MASITDQCPTCGVEPRSISSGDATVALRSYPRRYRVLLVRPDDEEGARVVTTRPGPDEWSALEHAAHAADVADAVSTAIQRVRVHDQPQVDIDAGQPRAGHVDDVVERVTSAFQSLAEEAERFQGEDWRRSAQLPDGQSVSALDLVRHAVHAGAHHRREIERVVERVRGRR